MRILTLILAAILTMAATPPVPDALKPYIKGDRFDPGDYGWMKGRFADASPKEKAQAAAIQAWVMACYASDLAEMRAELRALGITDPKMNNTIIRNPLCAQVASAPDVTHWRTFDAFQRSVEKAAPLADTYLLAVNTAKASSGSRTSDLHDLLVARPVAEQMLRYAMDWGGGDMADAPRVSDDVRAVILSRISIIAAVEDHRNGEWLKSLIAEKGWPKQSEVGEAGAAAAWLLAQHADADPALQLRVLRAMEPLLATGEVAKDNYAYLYDRIMLKITGKQRYGTQAMCAEGKRTAQPLEDSGSVDLRRAEVGLPPLANYIAMMDAHSGSCSAPS
ncbi:DUF6624 domain-containing protein [Sphingomonas sp. NPDC019816]|uniref:DUF6624 domain-containing protein n=1 Tax=Sphingomonas sp. NPDC019816 TaxID=3390679 RepID=UPI003CFC9E8E